MGINVNLSKLILRGTPFSVFRKSGALAGAVCAIIIPPYAISVRSFLFAPLIFLEGSSDFFFMTWNIETGVDLLMGIWIFSFFYCACLGVIAGTIAFALWRFKQLCLGLLRKGKTRVDARPLNQINEGQLTLFLFIGIVLILCGMIKCYNGASKLGLLYY
jgi:hypothetical protein